MTDEEHYNAMAESMREESITVVSGDGTKRSPLILGGPAIDNLGAALDLAMEWDDDDEEEDSSSNPCLDVELPEVESPKAIADRIIELYKEKYS